MIGIDCYVEQEDKSVNLDFDYINLKQICSIETSGDFEDMFLVVTSGQLGYLVDRDTKDEILKLMDQIPDQIIKIQFKGAVV